MQIRIYSLLDFTWIFPNREISERKKKKVKKLTLKIGLNPVFESWLEKESQLDVQAMKLL